PSGSSGAGSTATPAAVGNSAPPSGATAVASGSGNLKYVAKDDGTIYLFDESDGRVFLQRRIRSGQTFDFSPASGLANVDGRTVYQQTFSSNHRFKVYFEKK